MVCKSNVSAGVGLGLKMRFLVLLFLEDIWYNGVPSAAK